MWTLFLAVAVIVIFMMVAASSVKNMDTKTITTEKTCPPHKWSNDIQNRLFCKFCKIRPGELQTDYDKPY